MREAGKEEVRREGGREGGGEGSKMRATYSYFVELRRSEEGREGVKEDEEE